MYADVAGASLLTEFCKEVALRNLDLVLLEALPPMLESLPEHLVRVGWRVTVFVLGHVFSGSCLVVVQACRVGGVAMCCAWSLGHSIKFLLHGR